MVPVPEPPPVEITSEEPTPIPEQIEPPAPVVKSLAVENDAQETGYWCGPAAARIALSAVLEGLPSQTQLARDLGTTTNGTDTIGQVAQGLNKYSPGYSSKDGSVSSDELWGDVVRGIDNGRPLVANIVAPPGNQPPGYPSGETIYHYVAVIGYDSENKTVHVADSARFSGISEHWLSIEQLRSLVSSKGYTTHS